MIRVGIVAEGKSDWLALEELMRAVHPDVTFMRLRPEMTPDSHSPNGWKGVRAWCRQEGSRLEALMTGVVGQPIHLLVVHVDCSMAHNVAALHPCPPARDTADALREVVARDWLGRVPLPTFIVLATPSWTTDTWVTAALEPPYSGGQPLECDQNVDRELHRRRLLPMKEGELKKPEAKFRPLAEEMGRKIDHVCRVCTEAARFREDLTVALAAFPGDLDGPPAS